jgi:hypothetical protein
VYSSNRVLVLDYCTVLEEVLNRRGVVALLKASGNNENVCSSARTYKYRLYNGTCTVLVLLVYSYCTMYSSRVLYSLDADGDTIER